MTKITGNLHEDLCTFMIIPRSVILKMRNVSHKSHRGNQNKHFMFSNFCPENRAIYEIIKIIWYSQTGQRRQ